MEEDLLWVTMKDETHFSRNLFIYDENTAFILL